MLLSLEYTAEQAMRQSYFRQGGRAIVNFLIATNPFSI